MDPTTLYQFALSHYCEKARWALDYKGVPYSAKNLAPVFHIFTTKRIAPTTKVPILLHEGRVIQDSTRIIDYLDSILPDKSLTPPDANSAKEALEWEEYADREIGVHLRRYFYNFILQDAQLTGFLILQGAPSFAQKLFPALFPGIRWVMRKKMDIRPQTAEISLGRLTQALERVNQAIKTRPFLVGDRFSRADLAVASLLAPMCMPAKYGDFKWPADSQMPPVLNSFRQARRSDPFHDWVLKIYKNYR